MAAPKKSRNAALWPWLLVLTVVVGFVLFLALFLSGSFIRFESHTLSEGTPTPIPDVSHLPRLSEPTIDASAIFISDDAVTIRWEPVLGARRYVLRDKASATGFGRGTLGSTADTHMTVSGLVAGAEYTLQLVAYGDELRYRPSHPVEVTVQIPPDDGTGGASGVVPDE